MWMYFALQTLLLFIAFLSGYKLSKNPNNSFYFWLIVIAFTLIEGLRFGRGIDYNIYVHSWYNIVTYNAFSADETFLFNLYCRLLIFLGIPYQGLIISCSFILIYNGLSFLKKYHAVLWLSLPFFIVLCYSAENLFKWYTGFSFILLALSALNEGNLKKFILFSFIGCGIHPMLFLIVVAFWIINFVKKEILPPWLALSLYVVVSLIWTNEHMLMFTHIVTFFMQESTHYSMYSDRATEWLTGENRDEMAIAITTHIKMFCYFALYLYVGRLVVKKNKSLLLYYNVLVVGYITFPAMHVVELFDRYNQLFVLFNCLIGAYCFYFVLWRKIRVNRLVVIATFFLFLWQVNFLVTNNIVTNKWYTLYIWDSKGRDSLPIQYLINAPRR